MYGFRGPATPILTYSLLLFSSQLLCGLLYVKTVGGFSLCVTTKKAFRDYSVSVRIETWNFFGLEFFLMPGGVENLSFSSPFSQLLNIITLELGV